MKDSFNLTGLCPLSGENVRKLADEKHLQLSLFDEKNLAEVSPAAFPDERLVAYFSPLPPAPVVSSVCCAS